MDIGYLKNYHHRATAPERILLSYLSTLKMETHVLIPHELRLRVRPSSQCSSPSVAKLLEQQVTVVSTMELPKGIQIHPAQGTVRCGKLDIFSHLLDNDIRATRFGCYDEIINVLPETMIAEESSKSCRKLLRVRRCNWTRFLTFEDDNNNARANLKCTKNPQSGQVVFEAMENIAPNTDLVVSPKLDKEVLTGQQECTVIIRAIAAFMQDSPLDLSTTLVSPESNIMTSLSPVFLEDRISSVSSDSGLSSSEEMDCKLMVAPPSPPATPKEDKKVSKVASRRSSKKMLPCSFCGKCFDRPSLLNRHLRTHTGERPHVCDICEKGFSTSSSLNTHRRIHSGEKPHECSTCGKRFTASSNLYYHRMTHVKEKPHKCDLCQKSFPTPGDLKSHMYIHNGSWPHRCHICDRGFSKVTNLKNHLFLHTGQKPHECHKCGKRFALGCNMKAHLKTHEPGRVNSSKMTADINEDEEMALNVTD